MLQVMDPPAGYEPIRTPARKYTATPTPFEQGYQIPEEEEDSKVDVPKSLGPNLPDLKPEDYNFFSALLTPKVFPTPVNACNLTPKDTVPFVELMLSWSASKDQM